jgi:beta-glucosidase
VPLYYNALNTGRPVAVDDLTRPGPGDNRYQSRYIDELNAPLFPFGYGLSYTRFEYAPVTLSAPKASAAALRGGAKVTVRTTIKNVGGRDGIETVQLYVGLRGTSVALPVRQLKAFRRVALSAGEAKDIELTLCRDELAFWNANMKYVVEPSHVTVWVAPDARSGHSAELVITE